MLAKMNSSAVVGLIKLTIGEIISMITSYENRKSVKIA